MVFHNFLKTKIKASKKILAEKFFVKKPKARKLQDKGEESFDISVSRKNRLRPLEISTMWQ